MNAWAAFLTFAALLVLGTAAIVGRGAATGVEVVASRDIPAGWLLHAGDVTLGSSARYAKVAIAKGSQIDKENTGDMPSLTPEAGTVLVGMPVKRERVASGALNASAKVKVCRGSTEVLAGVSVRAALCPDGADCVVLLAIPSDQSAKLAASVSPPLTVEDTSQSCH